MKAAVIINGTLDGRTAATVEAQLRRYLPDWTLEIVYTAYRGHAVYLARRAAKGGADVVVVAGGDGTVSEALNGLIGLSALLAIVPCGTANDLACQLGIPDDCERACALIGDGCTRTIDVLCVNGWHYLTVGGLGAPTGTIRVATAMKRLVGRSARMRRLAGSVIYVAAYLIAVVHRHCPILTAGERVFSLTLANQPVLGRRFCISPGASNDDGLMDLCLIADPGNALGAFMVGVRTAQGRHTMHRGVTTRRVDRLTIRTLAPVRYFADGELFGPEREFLFAVAPRAVTVIVPSAGKESYCGC